MSFHRWKRGLAVERAHAAKDGRRGDVGAVHEAKEVVEVVIHLSRRRLEGANDEV